MSEPISKEERDRALIWDGDSECWQQKEWLRGYEALALELESVLDKTRMWAVVCKNSEKYEKEKCADLEQKIEDKSLKILAITEEMMNAEEASLVKILQLERRLTIAEKWLKGISFDGVTCECHEMATDALRALAAMAKEDK